MKYISLKFITQIIWNFLNINYFEIYKINYLEIHKINYLEIKKNQLCIHL